MSSEESDANYTVFIRVPFPRANFVDPPLVQWNATKDAELWKLLSSSPKGGEIDWQGLTARFDVALPFLLQQAAWLYERQLSQVREQLRRAKPSSNSPTPTSISGSTTTTPAGSHSMRRGGSSGVGGGSRGPSALSVRPRTSTELRNADTSGPSTPIQGHMPVSRTASQTTITQLPRGSSGFQKTASTSPKQQRRSIDSERDGSRYLNEAAAKRSPQPSNLDSADEDESSSDEAPTKHSHAFARRQRFDVSKTKNKKPLQALSSADEEEDDDSPAFLPVAGGSAPQKTQTGKQQVSQGKAPVKLPSKPPAPTSDPASSTSLSQSQHSSGPTPISPTNRTNIHSSPTGQVLATLSPRQRRIAQAGSESAGTPSMGSSFSDLDDASVTQSALEEALAREIKAGKGSIGVISRMGGLWKHGMGGQGGPSGSRPGV